MDLKNKVALVTGSSSGIGEAIAIALAKEGAKVVVNSRNNVKGGMELVQKIKKNGGQAMYAQADLSNANQVRELFENSIKIYKTVDILVNNAGEARSGKFDDIENWKYQFENILLTQVLVTNEFLKVKTKRQRKIVNISSIYGLGMGTDFNSIAYGAMKSAVNSMTIDLARKFGNEILVNAIAPGYTWTPPWGENRAIQESKLKTEVKIQRFVETEEIADMAVSLLKNDAITGQIITIDGGATLKELY